MIDKLKQKCKKIIGNTKKCALVGLCNGKEITLRTSRVMDILDDLFEMGLINDDYFDYIYSRAIISITSPNSYQRSMWEETRGDIPITITDESIFAFSCWIEDKYKGEEVAYIIKKYSKLDNFYLSYVKYGENDDDAEKELKNVKRKEIYK